jgi:hypothetical protein
VLLSTDGLEFADRTFQVPVTGAGIAARRVNPQFSPAGWTRYEINARDPIQEVA